MVSKLILTVARRQGNTKMILSDLNVAAMLGWVSAHGEKMMWLDHERIALRSRICFRSDLHLLSQINQKECHLIQHSFLVNGFLQQDM